MKTSHFLSTGILLAFSVLGAQSSNAGTINFSGAFTQDDNIQFFTFTLNNGSNVNISTTSFTAGGFVPWLHVWDSTGTGISNAASEIPDYAEAVVNITSLAAGTYYGALSQWHNQAPQDFAGAPGNFNTLFDPTQFSKYGQGNYTAADYSCPPGAFAYDPGTGCINRSGAWAFTITSLDLGTASLYPNSVPEPSSLGLALSGAVGFALFRRRTFRAS